MKKSILSVALLCAIVSLSSAQNWNPNNTNLVTSENTNNIGIHTTAPSERLTVKDGNISMPATADEQVRVITAESKQGMLYIGTNIDTKSLDTYGPMIQMGGSDNNWRQGSIWYHSYAQNADPFNGTAHVFLNYNAKKQNWTNLMNMRDQDGYAKVSIGDVPSQPDGYSLFVQNGILTEKVKVALASSGDWADYVFASDYILKQLSEVATFISINKHLPDMPSGEQLAEGGGIDVNQMFARQMQKIEELTLYILAQQKEIETMKEQLIGH